jgi:shikimate kinase
VNIILFGFKKCGKTYYGLRAAQKLGMNFIDSDLLLEKVYEQVHHQAISYRDIAKKHGFPFFRNLEKHVVSLLTQEKNCIISLGGGVVLDQDNISRLQQVGHLVYIKTSKDTLRQRILSGDLPSYFDPKHPLESFEALYKERLPIYEAIPAFILDTEKKTEEQILDDLFRFINKHRTPHHPLLEKHGEQ